MTGLGSRLYSCHFTGKGVEKLNTCSRSLSQEVVEPGFEPMDEDPQEGLWSCHWKMSKFNPIHICCQSAHEDPRNQDFSLFSRTKISLPLGKGWDSPQCLCGRGHPRSACSSSEFSYPGPVYREVIIISLKTIYRSKWVKKKSHSTFWL